MSLATGSTRTPIDEAPHYVINPLDPFPKRWRDHIGPLTVMCEPTKGYVMVRRPQAVPFVLHVRQLLNTEPHSIHGPFIVADKAKCGRP